MDEINMPEQGEETGRESMEPAEQDSPGGSVHAGRRKRIRARFREEGLASFAPHEVLELLLCYAKPRGDMNPVAHALLETFGSLKGVLEASPQQLMTVKGVGEEGATLLSLVLPLFRRYSMELAEERPRIASTEQARQYAQALLAGERTEHFYVICLGTNRSVLGRRLIAEGTVTEVAAYPRQVVETALNLGAQGVVLCHNHPDGHVEPSPEDIRTTHLLYGLLEALGISLLDHVIVAGDRACSLAERGELQPKRRRGT